MSKFVIIVCVFVFVSAANAGTESTLDIAKKRPLQIIKREVSDVNDVFAKAQRTLRQFSKNSSTKIDDDVHYKRFAGELAEIGTMVERIQKCDDDVEEKSLRTKLQLVVACMSQLVHRTKNLCNDLKNNLGACIDRVKNNGIC